MKNVITHLIENADNYGLALLGWLAIIYGALITTRELMEWARKGAALTQTKRDDQIVAKVVAGLDVSIGFVDALRCKLDSLIRPKK